MSITLKVPAGGTYQPHPDGIHPAVCVDIIDLGMEKENYDGRETMKPKLRIVWETEEKADNGRNMTLSRKVTKSLHEKSTFAELISKWRGRSLQAGEEIAYTKLIGASCTLVIIHKSDAKGIYALVDTVSKPTKKLQPSGHYDPNANRARINERRAKDGLGPLPQEDNGALATALALAASVKPAPPARKPVEVAPAKPVTAVVDTVADDDVPF
jgi:hypothetical protein